MVRTTKTFIVSVTCVVTLFCPVLIHSVGSTSGPDSTEPGYCDAETCPEGKRVTPSQNNSVLLKIGLN